MDRCLPAERGLTTQMPRGVAAHGRRHMPPAERQTAGHERTESPTKSDDRRGRYHLGGRSGQRESQALAYYQARVG